MHLKIIILLSLADNLNVFKSDFKSYAYLYAFLPKFKPSAIRVRIAQMLESGDIEKIRKNKQAYFSLTLSGFELLRRHFLIRRQGTWDGKLRLIIFEIPEKKREERDRIRKQILEAGFGRLYNSCYISPRSAPLQLDKGVTQFETRLSLLESKDIAKRAYKLDKLEREYKNWIKMADDSQVSFDTLVSYYDGILGFDPALPEKLLPDNWVRRKSWKVLAQKLKFEQRKIAKRISTAKSPAPLSR